MTSAPIDAGPVGVEVGELVVVRLGPGPDHRQGEQRHQADRQDRHRVPDDQVGDAHPEARASAHRQAPFALAGAAGRTHAAERPEDRAAEQGQQRRRQRQRGGQRDGQAQRDRRPGVLDLGEAGEEEHPQPDDHRPGRGDQRTADLADRLAQGVGPRPAAAQLLGIPRDQEQAVVGPRPEEDDDHEDLRDVDHLEPQAGHRRQAARSPRTRSAPTARS